MDTRVDYVKAALVNDRAAYEDAMADARVWSCASENYRVMAMDDAAALYGDMVNWAFPWLYAKDAEIREAYREVVEKFAEDLDVKLMAVRSGSAVYWHPGTARYLVCERPYYAGPVEIVARFAEFAAALDACDSRAGVCRPMDEYPESIPVPATA